MDYFKLAAKRVELKWQKKTIEISDSPVKAHTLKRDKGVLWAIVKATKGYDLLHLPTGVSVVAGKSIKALKSFAQTILGENPRLRNTKNRAMLVKNKADIKEEAAEDSSIRMKRWPSGKKEKKSPTKKTKKAPAKAKSPASKSKKAPAKDKTPVKPAKSSEEEDKYSEDRLFRIFKRMSMNPILSFSKSGTRFSLPGYSTEDGNAKAILVDEKAQRIFTVSYACKFDGGEIKRSNKLIETYDIPPFSGGFKAFRDILTRVREWLRDVVPTDEVERAAKYISEMKDKPIPVDANNAKKIIEKYLDWKTEERSNKKEMPNSWEKRDFDIILRDGKLHKAKAEIYGAWAVHKNVTGGGWGVTHTPSSQNIGYKLPSKKSAKAYIEAVIGKVPSLMRVTNLEKILENGKAFTETPITQPPSKRKKKKSVSERRDEIKVLIRESGLRSLGSLSGKSGEFYGNPKGALRISVGRNRIMANAMDASFNPYGKITSRWALEKDYLISKLTDDQVMQLVKWAKSAPSMVSIRQDVREGRSGWASSSEVKLP